jgi:hypothetical protein
MKKGYQAFNITAKSREEILTIFPPRFSNVVAHHITHKFKVTEDLGLPTIDSVNVIGYACNENIECLVVEVDGHSTRPDGKIYHLTLSHSDNAKPADSNDLIEDGWKNLPTIAKILITAIPTFNPFGSI